MGVATNGCGASFGGWKCWRVGRDDDRTTLRIYEKPQLTHFKLVNR